MIKKILSLTLAAILVFSSLAYASPNTELIGALGGFAPDEAKNVTRGEFVYMAAGLFAKGFSLEKTKTSFTDVASSNQYSGAVKLAADLGWVSGYGDGTFGVNDAVTLEQAIIITLRALGYEGLISAFGSYMSAANFIGLTEDVYTDSPYLTGDAASKLLKNALEANALVQTGFGDDLSWEADEGLTNLKQYLGIEAVEGIVTDNGITSLTGASGINDGYMKISGSLIFSGDIAISDYLGYRVRAYIKTEANVPELVYIENCDTEVIKIPAASIDTAANFRITYEDSYGKEKTSIISNVADYIYNGIADPDSSADDLKITDGAIVLIDNNGDGKADVVRIEDAETAVVQTVSYDASYISCHYGSDIAIKEDSEITVIKDGKVTDASAIEEWNVITVYKSKDSSVITIYVSDRIFRGTLTEKSSDRETLSIDGEKYILKNDSLYDSLGLGCEYEFCTDMYGSIVYTLDSFEYTVAVFMDAKGYSSSALADDVYVKVFTQEGRICEYKCADKINFCGKSSVAKADLPGLLANVPQYGLIGYNLNSEGLISRLCVTGEAAPSGYTPKDNFKKTYENNEIVYQAQQKSFAGKVMINNATVVFMLPADAADEDKYFVSGGSMFVSGLKYDITSYLAGTDDWYADYVVCIEPNAFSKTHGAILVDEINSAIDDDGEETEILRGYNEKGEVTYNAAEGFSFSGVSIKRGDIIRCILNPFGEVCAVRAVFSENTFSFINDSGESYSAQPRFIHGYVYEKNKNLLKISLYPNVPPTVTESNMEIHDLAGVKIYEYDKARNLITVINTDMLEDYMTYPAGFSKIFLYTLSSAPKFAVSYK